VSFKDSSYHLTAITHEYVSMCIGSMQEGAVFYRDFEQEASVASKAFLYYKSSPVVFASPRLSMSI